MLSEYEHGQGYQTFKKKACLYEREASSARKDPYSEMKYERERVEGMSNSDKCYSNAARGKCKHTKLNV